MSHGGQWRIIRHYLSMSNLNSEVEKLVQRVKPATKEQWDDLIQRFEKAVVSRLSSTTTTNEVAVKPEAQKKEKAIAKLPEAEEKAIEKSSSSLGSKEMTFESLLQGIKLKTDLHFGKISEPSWKSNKPTVSKTSIHSRTAYVISAIVSAETPESLFKRTENFVDHIIQYPESRDYAIREGAIRALLRVQNRLNTKVNIEKEVNGIVKEALALLGYAGPTKGPGPNILSIDGGGIRGIIAIEILKHMEKLTGRKVHEMFDFVIGVSTGAIIASVIGSGIGNLDTANNMYFTLSKKMFGNTSIIGGASRLVWSQSYYDTQAWEKLLQENLGDRTLSQCNRYSDMKLALVSCSAGTRLSPFVFRSYSSKFRVAPPVLGSSSALVWHAVRASAAAPTYFHEFHHMGTKHQDGGIMVNNPTGVGIQEAKLLFGPKAMKHACIISVGTGRPLTKHLDYSRMGEKDESTTSWKDKFHMILDSATDTEGTHHLLNDLLPSGSYYRFNPPLMEECAMDEISDVKLKNLVVDTNAYIRRNQHKFQQAAAMLLRKRSIAQRVVDYIENKSLLMGITQAK